MQFVPLHSIILKFLLVANEDVRGLLCSGPGMLREIPPPPPMLQRKPHTPGVSSPLAQRNLTAKPHLEREATVE